MGFLCRSALYPESLAGVYSVTLRGKSSEKMGDVGARCGVLNSATEGADTVPSFPQGVGWVGRGVRREGKGMLSFAQVASLWRRHHALPLSPHLTVHHRSSLLRRQPRRRSPIANAIQQIHFINFNYIPPENEWSENIKHLPSRSFTFFIQ